MMNKFFSLPLAVSLAVALAGCEVGPPPEAIYSGQLIDEFDDDRKFSADYVLVSRFESGTFVAQFSNFRFERRGFDAPTGTVQVTGTLTRNEEGTLMLEGTGESRLRQGPFRYDLAVEIGGEFIGDRANTIVAWYFGGGDFSRGDTYVDWPMIRGRIRADAH